MRPLFSPALAALLLSSLLACSGGDDTKKSGPTADKPAGSASKASPPAKPASPEPITKPAVPDPKPAAAESKVEKPPIRASISGKELRAWASKLGPGSSRIKSGRIPKPVKKELAALARPIGTKQSRARWVHILTPAQGSVGPTMVFSFGYVEGENEKQFWFAVIRDEGGQYVVRDTHEVSQSAGNNLHHDWGFAKRRDIDGDGHDDVLVEYSHYDRGGNWQWHESGTILLGSRGGVRDLRLQLTSVDVEATPETNERVVTDIYCWTKIDDQPALVLVRERQERAHRRGGKNAGTSATVIVADDAGRFVERLAFAVIDSEASSPRKLSKQWTGITGEKLGGQRSSEHDCASFIVRGKGTYRCPDTVDCTPDECPECRFKGTYHLIVGLAFTKDAALKRYQQITGKTPPDPPRFFELPATNFLKAPAR